jgi:hypothetical protein
MAKIAWKRNQKTTMAISLRRLRELMSRPSSAAEGFVRFISTTLTPSSAEEQPHQIITIGWALFKLTRMPKPFSGFPLQDRFLGGANVACAKCRNRPRRDVVELTHEHLVEVVDHIHIVNWPRR